MVDGEIEEVENPKNPSGPSLFRFVMFKATEKVSHKKKVETDKAKDDTNDFGLAFDVVKTPKAVIPGFEISKS